MSVSERSPTAFPTVRRKLLRWFKKNQRDYPWRRTGNWFHLLMAEMMLRRTRADQVAPVYEDFCGRFSTPVDAHRCPPRKLEQILEPLGLKWRSRQMRETFAYLKDTFARRAPGPGDDLEAIPGVGPYSSAMLRNRLFGEAVATVDSNVARFICRLSGREFHAESRRNKEVIALANRFVKSKHSQDLNLAVLDLSALVCKPGRPLCGECPVAKECDYGRQHTVT